MKQIAIIGAGPIGCYAAYLLAKQGHCVTIYENHATVGAPIQCTGILTGDYDEFGFGMDEYLVNTIDAIEVYTPNRQLKVKQKDYIVCRTKFDQFMGAQARGQGAKILVNHTFLRKEGSTLIIKDTKNGVEKQIVADVVIAADGPLSPTAKAYGFYHNPRENFYGVQATVHGNFLPTTIKTYFGKDVCPGLFAWVTPESATTARVGLATKQKSRTYFDQFMDNQGFTATQIQAGTIPIYHPKQLLHKDNCYVIGDAASFVKATTLGGIVPAMRQVQALANSFVGCRYTFGLRKVRRQLALHLKIHQVMQKFSDTDWDELVSYVAQPKVQRVFERYTRDNPVPLVLRAVLQEPRFLKFLKYV